MVNFYCYRYLSRVTAQNKGNGTVSLVIQEWGSFNLNTVENVLRKTSLTKPSANAHFVHHKINKNRTNPNRNSDHVSLKKYSPKPPHCPQSTGPRPPWSPDLEQWVMF